jgi:TIR domain
MVEVFFSYSHRDEKLRDELEIHLAMLKRQGVIGTWHDRRIGAGNDVVRTISEHLESAHIVLLLVSPYFLASDYCYDVEMSRALERHDAREARVIPIILEPSDWKEAPFGKLLATPRDGKPISKFSNMHDAFLQVVEDIRAAIVELDIKPEVETAEEPDSPLGSDVAVHAEPRSSNLRVRRKFTDKERDDYLDGTYQYIKTFFENSLSELHERNSKIETRFVDVDRTHFTCAAYSGGAKTASCRIWMSGRGGFPNGIGYGSDESGGDNSFNEALSVVDDGYSLLLCPMGVAFSGHSNKDSLTKHGAAEYLWAVFIQPLQRREVLL